MLKVITTKYLTYQRYSWCKERKARVSFRGLRSNSYLTDSYLGDLV